MTTLRPDALPHADNDARQRDVVTAAEAMADRHIARQREARRVAGVVRWMDDLVRVPGTKLGFGLDPILGLILPGVGDAVAGVLGLSLLVAATRRGVPRVVLARMLLNIAVDTIVGSIPVLGDAFDVFWRANVKNLALLERHTLELEPRARRSDYAIVAAAVVLVAVSIAAPIVLVSFLIGTLLG